MSIVKKYMKLKLSFKGFKFYSFSTVQINNGSGINAQSIYEWINVSGVNNVRL